MEPERKLVKARTKMIANQPFWGALALKFPLTEVSPMLVPTMATDNKRIMYNKGFVEVLPFKYLITAVGHEIGHIMFLHCARQGKRDHELWNKAGDYAINALLKDSEFEPIPGWLYDDRFDGMSAEEIYKILHKEEKKKKKGKDGEGDDGSTGGGGGGNGDNDADGWTTESIAKAIENEKNSKPNKGKCCGGLKPMESDDGSGRAASKHEIDAMAEDMKQIVAQAAHAAKMAGKLPAGLERFIDQWVNPKVNWKERIHRFVDNNARNDYTWMRPNRRFIWSGGWMPSLNRPCLEHVVCVVDTSGSINNEILTQFGSEISACLETVDLGKLTVMYCDTQVGDRVQEFEKNDLPMKLSPQGGGGTMFSPAFNYVEEQGMEPTVLIYLTDLWCDDYPKYTPEYPVLWACYDDSYKSWKDQQPPFGEVVMLE